MSFAHAYLQLHVYAAGQSHFSQILYRIFAEAELMTPKLHSLDKLTLVGYFQLWKKKRKKKE